MGKDMRNDLGIELIAVINSVKVILYEAKGIKITKPLGELSIVLEKHHHKQEKAESHYQKRSAPGSLFEPHSSPKDLEYHEAAHNVSKILEEKINNNPDYTKLIIVAEPKMLGCLRKLISNKLKKIIYKEVVKDLVGQDMNFIEKSVFK